MEIRYIPADENSINTNRCYRGCSSCTPASIEETDNEVKIFNGGHIQQINEYKKGNKSNSNQQLNRSVLSLSRKSPNRQNSEKKSWQILHQNYLQVAVLTNANLWSFAPQGLSKLGHIGDGLLDLILIEPTNRKDFLRYVKRNGKSKDQYGFSFTKLLKVKEIEIELKSTNNDTVNSTLNFNDDFYSSSSSLSSDDLSNEDNSNNENRSSFTSRHEPRPPSIPPSQRNRRSRHHHLNQQIREPPPRVSQSSNNINSSAIDHRDSTTHRKQSENELHNSSTDLYRFNASSYRKSFFQSLRLKKDKNQLSLRPPSAADNQNVDEQNNPKHRRPPSEVIRSARSLLSLLKGGNSLSNKREKSSSNSLRDSRPSTASFNHTRQPSNASQSSSIEDEKPSIQTNKTYHKKKQPCMWNLDFTPYNSTLIRVKCFCRFLPVFGVGVDSYTQTKEVNYTCFGRMS